MDDIWKPAGRRYMMTSNKPVLTYNKEGDTYNPSPCGWTMEREGNPNHWCLRKDGEYVDRDKYRIDLAERNGVQLGSEP